jgi:uncharacterized LabA/DUF88 family protein
MALDHLTQPGEAERRDLYRIFVYDCPPLAKKAQYPISGEPVDFSKDPMATFSVRFHQELTKLRKVVLRLGRLHDSGRWRDKNTYLDGEQLAAKCEEAFSDGDFEYDVSRKGVEMRIGLDIASVAYKKQADQIVLVGSEADFVPAAKLARREGIDFILDPMWQTIPRDLNVHIDGVRSMCPKPPTMREMAEQRRRMKELAEKEKAPPPASPAPENQNGKVTRLY